MRLRYIIVLLIPLLCLFACTSNKVPLQPVKEALSSFIGSKISIDSVLLIPVHNNNPNLKLNYREAKYKLYVYIDTLSCTTCKISKMRQWEDLYPIFQTKESAVIMIFNSNNIQGLQNTMELYEMNFPYFLDIEHNFSKFNPHIPKIETLQTFLTRNDTVVIAGNPLNNNKMIKLYQAELSIN